MKTSAGLLLAAALLVGCGGHKQSAAEKAAMEARFAELDYAMSSVTLSAPPYNENLEGLTEQYVKAIRKYHDDLGDDELKRRLADKAVELAPYCLPCVGMLDQEREKY